MRFTHYTDQSFASGYAILPRGDNKPPLKLLVTALSPLFEFNIEKYVPVPPPPAEYAKKPGTNKLIKDDHGNPVLIKRRDDPDYQRKLTERILYISAWTTYQALRDDTNVSWDNAIPEKLTHLKVTEWLKSLLDEIVGAGFTMGDMRIIIEKTSKLGNNVDELVQEQAETFLFEEREIGQVQDGNLTLSQDGQSNT